MKWTITSTTTGVTLATGLEADTPGGAFEALAQLVAKEDNVPVEYARRRIAEGKYDVTRDAPPPPAEAEAEAIPGIAEQTDRMMADVLVMKASRGADVAIYVPAMKVSADVEAFVASMSAMAESRHAVAYVMIGGRVVRVETKELGVPPTEAEGDDAPDPTLAEMLAEPFEIRRARRDGATIANDAAGVVVPETACTECGVRHRPGENTLCSK